MNLFRTVAVSPDVSNPVRKSSGIFGKPSHRTLEYIVKATGFKPEQIAIVGDRMYTDIAVADHSDVVSIRSISGETKEEDVPSR